MFPLPSALSPLWPRPIPRPSKSPPHHSGPRARAGGGGWGRICGEIPRLGSRTRPRPGLKSPPGPPGSAMIKAILIFNNHGKPRLSKFYQPYVSIPPPPKWASGSRWQLAAPSVRLPPARRGPSRAPAAWRCGAVSLRVGVSQVPISQCAPSPPTWLPLAAPPPVCCLGGFPAARSRPWRLPGAGPSRVGQPQPTCAR